MLKTKKTEQELLELLKTRQSDYRKHRSGQRLKKTKSTPKKASEVLKDFFKNEPQALKKMKESQALLSWQKYVGPEAAKVSKAVKLKEQELVVIVVDGLWMHQLILLKQDILKQYRKDFPELKIQQIFFKRGEFT